MLTPVTTRGDRERFARALRDALGAKRFAARFPVAAAELEASDFQPIAAGKAPITASASAPAQPPTGALRPRKR